MPRFPNSLRDSPWMRKNTVGGGGKKNWESGHAFYRYVDTSLDNSPETRTVPTTQEGAYCSAVFTQDTKLADGHESRKSCALVPEFLVARKKPVNRWGIAPKQNSGISVYERHPCGWALWRQSLLHSNRRGRTPALTESCQSESPWSGAIHLEDGNTPGELSEFTHGFGSPPIEAGKTNIPVNHLGRPQKRNVLCRPLAGSERIAVVTATASQLRESVGVIHMAAGLRLKKKQKKLARKQLSATTRKGHRVDLILGGTAKLAADRSSILPFHNSHNRNRQRLPMARWDMNPRWPQSWSRAFEVRVDPQLHMPHMAGTGPGGKGLCQGRVFAPRKRREP